MDSDQTSVDFMKFLKHESAVGILLFFSAVLAIIFANTGLNPYYEFFINIPVLVQIGELKIDKPLLLLVNDGFMAIFFFMVGLELKREFYEGELSSIKKVILPGIAAVGGMAVPALIYYIMNIDDPVALRGWAIPAATDIAFALGVLSLLGSRVPVSLKVFLTTIAIFDDIGAIAIIAVFYNHGLHFGAMGIAIGCMLALLFINRRGIDQSSIYILIGIAMWVAVLKSGVHATLAGVVLAMFIPMYSRKKPEYSPVKSMEHDVHFTVAFLILPVFAFCNAGVNFSGMGLEQVLHPVPLGITFGLFFGKQIGVFGFSWLAVKLKVAELPKNTSWFCVYGTSLLCGIGFTMSLFIGALAFKGTGQVLPFDERIGIMLGSLLSGVVGYFVLDYSLKKLAAKNVSQHRIKI
nr:Na+/H+ antiporter NhaA [Cytophagales bacterium]